MLRYDVTFKKTSGICNCIYSSRFGLKPQNPLKKLCAGIKGIDYSSEMTDWICQRASDLKTSCASLDIVAEAGCT